MGGLGIALGGRKTSNSGGGGGILVKMVQAGDSFPTTRADGTPLVLGDFVKPKGTLPFTIGTVTFSTYQDSASWTGVEWLLNANPFQKTSETPLANKTTESVSGTANYQNQVNAEVKTELGKKIDKIDTAVSIEHAVVKKSDGTYGLMQVNINANAGLAIVRRDLDKQINVPLVPASDKNAASKQYADTKTAQVSSLATPTVAMIGKAPVQYIGPNNETVTPKLYHGYYYEVISDGAGGAKWENINVSKGVMPYLNGVLLDGNKSTEDVRISFTGTRAQWNALSADEKKCRFAVITDENAIPQLHIALVVNSTTGKLKAQLWDVTDTTKVAESAEVEAKDNDALHSGSFLTTIPSGQTGAGKHGIKFTKADGTFLYMVLEDSEDKLITALDTATLQNKTISGENNTVINLDAGSVKATAKSTEIAPSASATNDKFAMEKAVRIELDKKQDTILAGDNITIGDDGKTIKSNQIDDTLSTSTTKTWSIDAIKEGIRVMGATYRGTFATKAALIAYSGTKEKNDRAVVTKDETHDNATTMYIFDGSAWVYEYVISDKPLEFDDSTIHINTSGKVEVKDKGITPAKMADQDTTKAEFALQVKTDGTIDFDRIRQYKSVNTFASESGNDKTLYYLAAPCIIGAKSYSIGLYVWSSATSFKQVADIGGGGGSSPILVGVVSPGGFMPTKRPDGSDLVIGDFVKPYSGATFPFTVSGVEFKSANDAAIYMTGGNWLVNATVFQKTNETPVNNATNESINGSLSSAVYQAAINIENAAAINAAAKTVTFEKTSDGKIHLNVKDRSGNNIAEVNIENIVFAEDEQTLKNKTIEAADNKIDPIIDVTALPTSNAKKAVYRRTSDNTLWYSRDGGSNWYEVGKEQVFTAVYDPASASATTHYNDLLAAYNKGKMMQVKIGSRRYPFRALLDGDFYFFGLFHDEVHKGKLIVCYATDSWEALDVAVMAKPTNESTATVGTALFKTLEGSEWKNYIITASLPTASATEKGNIYLYKGNTTATLTHGFFYECRENAGAYSWNALTVQESDVFIAVYDLDDPTQSTAYSKVKAAFDAGKVIIVKRGFHYYPLQYFEFEEFTFIGTDADDRSRGRKLVCNSSVWTDEEIFNLSFPSNNSDAQAGDVLCKTADGTEWKKYIQTASLPTASASEAGRIYMYTGPDVTTAPKRVHGHFYECKQGTTAGTYEWKDLDSGGYLPVVTSMPPAETLNDKTVLYDGATSGSYRKGQLYQRKAYSYWSVDCDCPSVSPTTLKFYTSEEIETDVRKKLYSDAARTIFTGYWADVFAVYNGEDETAETIGTVVDMQELTGYQWSPVYSTDYLPLAGGEMQGNIDMGKKSVTNVKELVLEKFGSVDNMSLSIDEDGGIIDSGNKKLRLKTDGEMSWNGKFLVKTAVLTGQTRESVFALAKDTEGKTVHIHKVCFTDAESPMGSAGSQFEVEVHSTGTSSSPYGYILAKNRGGIYLCNIELTNYGVWQRLATGDTHSYSGMTRLTLASTFGINGMTNTAAAVSFAEADAPEGNTGYNYFCTITKTGSNTEIIAHRTANGNIFVCRVTGSTPTASAWTQVLTSAGGPLSGTITFDVSQNQMIKGSDTTGLLQIKGGNAFNTGSSLQLSGRDSGSAGNFQLQARNSSGYRILLGTAEGSLTWGDNNVLTSAKPAINSATVIDSAVIINNQTKWWKVGKVVYVVLNCKIGTDGVAKEVDIYKGLPNCDSALSPYFPCYVNSTMGSCYITSSGTIRTNLAVSSSSGGLWLRGFVSYVEA